MLRVLLFVLFLITLKAQNHSEYSKPIQEEGDKERMAVITGCWILAIQDQARNAHLLENLLSILTQQIVDFDRSRAVEKIQIDMVRQCFRVIKLNDAEDVIDSITDPNIQIQQFRDVVKDFDYSSYATKNFSFDLDKFERFLQELIKELEITMGKFFGANTQQNQQLDTKIFGMSSFYFLYIYLGLFSGLVGIERIRSKLKKQKKKKRKMTIFYIIKIFQYKNLRTFRQFQFIAQFFQCLFLFFNIKFDLAGRIMLNKIKLEDNDNDSEYHEYINQNVFSIMNKLNYLKNQSKNVLFQQLSKVQEIKKQIRYQDQSLQIKLNKDVLDLEKSFKNVMYYYSFLDEYSVNNLFMMNDTQPIYLKNQQEIKVANKNYYAQNIKIEANDSNNRLLNKSSQESNNNSKRGPYKKYSATLKQQALDLVQIFIPLFQQKLDSGNSINQVCQLLQIPKKNLRRWIEIGAERKKGGGRKLMDRDMEEQLHQWCMNECLEKGKPVSRNQIREKALEISKYPQKFKASKGWTDKFVKKYNIRQNAIKQLEQKGLYQAYRLRKLRELHKKKLNQQFNEKKEKQQQNNRGSSSFSRLLRKQENEENELKMEIDISSNYFLGLKDKY